MTPSGPLIDMNRVRLHNGFRLSIESIAGGRFGGGEIVIAFEGRDMRGQLKYARSVNHKRDHRLDLTSALADFLEQMPCDFMEPTQ